MWFCGLVAIPSALLAEGRKFKPRQNLLYFMLLFGKDVVSNLAIPRVETG